MLHQTRLANILLAKELHCIPTQQLLLDIVFFLPAILTPILVLSLKMNYVVSIRYVPSPALPLLPIKYSREALLNLNGHHRMPAEVWQTVKHLNLNANRPTHRKRRQNHGKHNLTDPASATMSVRNFTNLQKDELTVAHSTDVRLAPSEPTIQTLYNNDTYDCFCKKGFHCIHLNARSLIPKISEVRLIASETKPSIFGISESWLDDSVTNCEIEIPGFSVVRNDRNRNGEGVCIYVNSSLAFIQRTDLLDPNLEAVWVEILLPRSKPIIIGACYRSQTHLESDFTEKLENIMNNLPNDSDVIILGDMNM